jgi:hypothetical protein
MDIRTDSYASLVGVRLVSSLLDRPSARSQLQRSLKAKLEVRSALAPALKQQCQLHTEVQKVEETLERLQNRAAVLHYRQADKRLAAANQLKSQLQEELERKIAGIEQDAHVQTLAFELQTRKAEIGDLEKHYQTLHTRIHTLKSAAQSQALSLSSLRQELHSLRLQNRSLAQTLGDHSAQPTLLRCASHTEIGSNAGKRRLKHSRASTHTLTHAQSERIEKVRDWEELFKACMDAWTREFRRTQLVSRHGRGLSLYFESITPHIVRKRPVTSSFNPTSCPSSPTFPRFQPTQLLTCLSLSSPLRMRLQRLLFPSPLSLCSSPSTRLLSR